ncbi:hypothetical protein F4677DRAFT_378562 [Hypoxylon crocopeplum]|nr:hypothetical protein F4677DRAFT_378562 [Hypoxylon crocopeplum]
MYSLLASVLACWSLLATVTVAKPVANFGEALAHRPARRDVQLSTPRYLHPQTKRAMVKRDANTTFDLGFEAKDVTLFSGDWAALGQDFSLDLTCKDCKTFGTLVASAEFPEDLEDLLGDLADLNPLNDASLSVSFQGVGALVDLSVAIASDGQFTIPLFVPPTPLGISGPGFTVGITFGVDLVIGISAEVEVEGGFQVAIPDGSSFTIPLDPTVDNVAKFDGAQATLLPLTANAPASVTVALRLRVQAGLDLPSSPLLDAQALAGAFINIPEVILSEEFTTSPANGSNCILPASAEININAGVFVDIGADIGDIQLADFNPTLSTTLFSAVASTCFVTVGQDTATAAIGTGVAGTGVATGVVGTGTGTAGAPCPMPLETSTATTMRTFAITSCAAAIANCPASLTQVIVVSAPETVTSAYCPLSPNATAVLPPLMTAPYANTTAAATEGVIPLDSLTAPVTNSLTVDPSVVAPDVPSITGSAKATVTQDSEAAVSSVDVMKTYYTTVTPASCSSSATMM